MTSCGLAYWKASIHQTLLSKACISSPFIIAAYKAGQPTATITTLVQVADSCPRLHTSAGLISSVGATIVQGHSFYFFW